MEAVVRDGAVELFTRNGNSAETYFPRLLAPPTWIEAREAIVDGEVVALDEAGRPDFGLLQERLGGGGGPLVFQAFDLLHLDGLSLLDVPLEQRKRLLERVLRPNARVQYARHVETEGVAFFEAAKAQALEGIVAKHRRSRYEPGKRSSSWLKIKVRPGAGAGGRRLDARGGDRGGARGARGRGVRRRAAAVRRQDRLRLRRADAAEAP